MRLPRNLPRHLWRFSTPEAQQSLAARFGLPLDDSHQDWEFTEPHCEQIPDYLAFYESGEATDDEKFTLMMMLLDRADVENQAQTAQILALAERDLHLHLHTVHYFACVGETLENAWDIAPLMRALLRRHPELWKL